jgi:beta-glucosidase
MPHAVYTFPPGFLWGTATASHQVEGGNTNNNWYAWENQQNTILENHQAGDACGWWNGRWKEDFDRAADGGQNAHRLSIEWSRVQPAPDRWDEQALDYYREMLRGLVHRGITPMVSLHHFTDPLWLTEMGGWENDQSPVLFEKYVHKTVEAIREYVHTWVTINEPNVYVYGGYLGGGFPPGKNDLKTAFQVLANMLRGHAAAYHTIHALQTNALVGVAPNYRSMAPARSFFALDRLVARQLSASYNDAFPRAMLDGQLRFAFRSQNIPEAVGTQDFIGVNYYTRDLVEFVLNPGVLFSRRYFPPKAELSETGFLANVPQGFFEALRWASQFGKPIFVTENGVDDSSDSLRPRYLLEHLHQLWHALNYDWDIRGYFHWTLVDNFEWERGWTQRFGLWELNTETQQRTPRPSAQLYAEICKGGAITPDLVNQYAPQSLSILYPV